MKDMLRFAQLYIGYQMFQQLLVSWLRTDHLHTIFEVTIRRSVAESEFN